MRRLLNALQHSEEPGSEGLAFSRPAPSLTVLAAGLAISFGASCHSHDDGATGAGGGTGTTGDFNFSSQLGTIREGQLSDISASLLNGAPATISNWMLSTNVDGALVELPAPDAVRFIAGDVGSYVLEASDAFLNVGTLNLEVLTAGTALTVTEVIAGTDNDLVFARLAVSGEDLFIAERIGGAAAPQVFARADRSGTRGMEVTLPYKIQGLAAAPGGAVTATRTAATLTDALVRYDRDLNEVASFAAPDLGTALWSDRIAMSDEGETLVPTDLNGGSILRLDVNGDPAGGTLQDSLLPLPVAFADLVDITVGQFGEVYAATSTEMGRTSADGTVDTTLWTPSSYVAIRAMDCDSKGILHVALQDADGGQCGSIRRFNWLGGQIRRISDYNDPNGSRFAARKVLNPQDLAAYPEGSWRMYDDTVTLDPTIQSAAWIVAGNVPIDGK